MKTKEEIKLDQDTLHLIDELGILLSNYGHEWSDELRIKYTSVTTQLSNNINHNNND